MLFQTYGDKKNPAVLFFHAMGVTGASSEPIARYLQDRYFCILPTSTVYCEGQKYVSKPDEIRQVEDFLHRQGVERLAMVVASSIGADLAMANHFDIFSFPLSLLFLLYFRRCSKCFYMIYYYCIR